MLKFRPSETSLSIRRNLSLCNTCKALPEKLRTCVPGSMPSGMLGKDCAPHSTVCLPPFHLQTQTSAGQAIENVLNSKSADSEASTLAIECYTFINVHEIFQRQQQQQQQQQQQLKQVKKAFITNSSRFVQLDFYVLYSDEVSVCLLVFISGSKRFIEVKVNRLWPPFFILKQHFVYLRTNLPHKYFMSTLLTEVSMCMTTSSLFYPVACYVALRSVWAGDFDFSSVTA
uniref:Uncharacterized protein n=1 Tax=Glossina austeni TaxID=7395 RepID=A0A1A9UGM5_GLOAU